MSSVLRKNTSAEAWSQWIDGLHSALGRAKAALEDAGREPRVSMKREHHEGLLRDFHLIKASAQALGLHGVQAVAHELESRVIEHRTQSTTIEKDRKLHGLLKEGVRKLDSVLAKLHEMSLQTAARRELSGKAVADDRVSGLLSRVGSAARGIGVDLGQPTQVETLGGTDVVLEKDWESWLEAALLHAVRNSLDHGGVRAQTLKIKLEARLEKGALIIECSDSGSGIDPERVREAARARHARFDAEMGGMSDEDVLQLLFLPALSLSRGTSLLSGRGYGLNIVREAVETRLRGKARLASRPGHGTRLTLRIPTKNS